MGRLGMKKEREKVKRRIWGLGAQIWGAEGCVSHGHKA